MNFSFLNSHAIAKITMHEGYGKRTHEKWKAMALFLI
jgi:hypothetical protein